MNTNAVFKEKELEVLRYLNIANPVMSFHPKNEQEIQQEIEQIEKIGEIDHGIIFCPDMETDITSDIEMEYEEYNLEEEDIRLDNITFDEALEKNSKFWNEEAKLNGYSIDVIQKDLTDESFMLLKLLNTKKIITLDSQKGEFLSMRHKKIVNLKKTIEKFYMLQRPYLEFLIPEELYQKVLDAFCVDLHHNFWLYRLVDKPKKEGHDTNDELNQSWKSDVSNKFVLNSSNTEYNVPFYINLTCDLDRSNGKINRFTNFFAGVGRYEKVYGSIRCHIIAKEYCSNLDTILEFLLNVI